MSSNLLEVVLEAVVKGSDVRVESSSSNYNLSQINAIFGTEMSGAVNIAYTGAHKTVSRYRLDIQLTCRNS